MRRAEREGMIHPESLELFLIWMSLGGLNRGISLTELTTLDGATLVDFVWLLGQRAKARKRKKRRDEAKKEAASVSTHPRSKTATRRR